MPYPIVLNKAYVVSCCINTNSFQAAQIQLLRIARVRLHDDLELCVALHSVWVIAIAAVIRPY